MSDFESRLRAIWVKYEPQREAERNAAETRATAARELADLNARRMTAGLPIVSEYHDQSFGGLQMSRVAWVGPSPKTWRDEMDAELLSAIRGQFS